MVHFHRPRPNPMVAGTCLIFAMTTACLAGCDKPKSTAKVQTTTTVREHSAIDLGPSTRPTSRPTKSVFLIDGREVSFPAALLFLQQSQPTVGHLLFS